jgi:hypothetical protein
VNPLFDVNNPLQNQLVSLFQTGGMYGQDEGNLGRSLLGGGLWWADKNQPTATPPPPGTPGGAKAPPPLAGPPAPQAPATPTQTIGSFIKGPLQAAQSAKTVTGPSWSKPKRLKF